MKKLCGLCITILVLFSLLILPGCKPEFGLSNLAISPQQIAPGESATVSVDISNTGNGGGIYPAVLKIDDVQVADQNVSVDPGTTQKVNFTVTNNQPGSHIISVGNLTQTITVLKPAEFRVGALNVLPTEPIAGSDTWVTIDVTNIGEVKGDFEVTLKVNDEAIETKKISLAGGATETVSFIFTPKQAGSQTIGIGDLTQAVKFLKPAEFKLGALKVSPAEVLAGWSSTTTVDVTNVGEVRGDYQVTLKVNNAEVESKTVSLDGGATDTVSFTLLEDQGGTYDLSVAEQSGTLTVKEGVLPTLHVGDQWVYRINYQGTLYTQTETIPGEENLEGKDCDVVQVTYNPKMGGLIAEETRWWEKASGNVVVSQFSAQLPSGGMINRTWTYSYLLTGSQWPLLVGNQCIATITIKKVDVLEGVTYSDQDTYTETFNVEKIETVTTNAGTFRCFKIVIYSNGNAESEQWYSDKAKATVKYNSLTSDYSLELLSYSVKDGGL